MLPKVEFSHLYKFLVSVGLVLLGSSVALPWIVLRERDVALLKATEIQDLTPIGQKVVRSRQRDFLWVVDHYKWGSATLAISGVALVVFGFYRWSKRQAVVDELEDLARDQAKLTVRDLSPHERERKLEQAAEEVAETETALAIAEPASAEGDGSGVAIPAARGAARRLALMHEVQRAERALEDAVTRAFEPTHRIRADVRITEGKVVSDEGEEFMREVDLLAQSRSDEHRPSWIFEVKYSPTVHSIQLRLRDILLDLGSFLLMASTRRRDAGEGLAGVAVIVVPSASSSDEELLRSQIRRASARAPYFNDIRLSYVIASISALEAVDGPTFLSGVKQGQLVLLDE